MGSKGLSAIFIELRKVTQPYNFLVILFAKRKKKGRRQVGTGIPGATPMSNNQILVFYVKVTYVSSEFLKPK